MKKLLPVFMCFIITLFALTSCEQEASSSGVPVVNNIGIATSLSNLQNGIFVTTVTKGITYYIAFIVNDEDLDINKITVYQTSGDTTLGPTSISCPEQLNSDYVYYTTFTPIYTGFWSVSAFATDDKNQTSPVCTIEVNSVDPIL
jgi:hypothetical protein